MYIIKKVDNKEINMFDSAWESADVAEIATVNWAEFPAAPKTTGKLLYNDECLYVQLETDEKNLLARKRNQNDMVCTDSCMEFFFRPNENDPRYMNFEFNPFGTMYFAVRTSRYDGEHPDKDKTYFNVKSYVDDTKWVLQFCVPFAYMDEVFSGHSKTLYGNLYKCGDETETMHYATFYPVGTENPDYHRPEFFGPFVLE